MIYLTLCIRPDLGHKDLYSICVGTMLQCAVCWNGAVANVPCFLPASAHDLMPACKLTIVMATLLNGDNKY